MALVDGQWRLVYPGTDLVFGDGDPYVIAPVPELGSVEPEVQDTPYPSADGTRFGRDYRPGRTVTFEFGVNKYAEVDGADAHGTLAKAWRADAIRTTPGAVAELHVRRAGRERVAYGRPRRFASAFHEAVWSGYSLATADFVASDDLWYDASESVMTLGLVPTDQGGFITPFVFPLTSTAASGSPAGQVQSGGLVETWPVVTFQGPVQRPSIELTGLWKFELDANIAFDQSVTIDTRPWARTVLRSDGASLAGKLTRKSARLSKATIPPGESFQVRFTGTDLTGTASMSLRFRDAYPHI